MFNTSGDMLRYTNKELNGRERGVRSRVEGSLRGLGGEVMKEREKGVEVCYLPW